MVDPVLLKILIVGVTVVVWLSWAAIYVHESRHPVLPADNHEARPTVTVKGATDADPTH